MTKREMLILLLLAGKYIHTSDPRGGGYIVQVNEKTVIAQNNHFRIEVKHNEAWFVPLTPEVTVTTMLTLIDELVALLGE